MPACAAASESERFSVVSDPDGVPEVLANDIDFSMCQDSALGLAANSSAPTYESLYSGEWIHPAA